jgi:pimeloyl-ACP methyl ester carboxylesterase
VIAITLGAMFDFQSKLIFPTHAVAHAGPLPQGAERLSVRASDEAKLSGVFVPADNLAPSKRLILGFGGNAWNGQDVAEYLHELFPDEQVVTFHYRGYAPSTGEPSADAIIADAPLVYDAAVERVKPERIVAVGFSIGSGVAATLAKSRHLDGLILVTPFDSLKSVATSMYPWLPIGPIFAHEIDAVAALDGTDVPVAIVAAAHDEIVPADRTVALREQAKHVVYDHIVANSGHNDIYARSDFQDAMREALAAVSD